MRKVIASFLLAVLLILSTLGQDRVMRRPLYPAAGGGFLPSDLSNLKIWHKADALSLANNDPVTSWADSSGNSWTLYDQNTGTKSPTYLTSQINSLPAVSFDGTSDELRSGTSGGGGTSVTWGTSLFTSFLVFQDNSPNPGAGVAVLWYGADDGGGFPMFMYERYTNSSQSRIRAFDTGGTTYGSFQTISNGTTSGDWHIISVVRRASEIQVYVDGVANTAVSTSGTRQNKSTPLWVGGEFGGSLTKFKLAEAYTYTTDLSDTDRHSNEGYLSSKYGISVSVQ